MARKVVYDDELMLDAVVQFAETNPGKIRITELVNFAQNIPGLKGITENFFKRKITDSVTGKKVSRPAKIRIDEINAERQVSASANAGYITDDKEMDGFFELAPSAQKKTLVAIKNEYHKMKAKLAKATDDLEAYKHQAVILTKEIDQLKEMQKESKKKDHDYKVISKQLQFLLSKYTEEQCKEKLEEEGLAPFFDTVKYRKYLEENKVKNEVPDLDDDELDAILFPEG